MQSRRDVPPFAKLLLGGGASLRGFRVGSAAGDNLVAASAELRVPVNAPVSIARTGVSLFYDAGTAYDHGQHLRDQKLERGVGVGWFVTAPLFVLHLDVARGIGRGTRVHVTAGVAF